MKRLTRPPIYALICVAVLGLAGCTKAGEIALGGITAIRSACPAVAVPAATGDVTVFSPDSSTDASALDVTALLTNVRSTCTDSGENVLTTVTFDVRGRRTDTQGARDVVLPYFITVVQGGSAVVAKSVSRVNLHFDAGQDRASATGQAEASVVRAAATLPDDIRKTLTRPRKAGEDDAATDPLSRPNIRAAVQRATFEALVGFQLTDAQLKYNATR
ncbi:MAG: hypothetical protein ACKVOB_04435 [Sphingomonas sp.]